MIITIESTKSSSIHLIVCGWIQSHDFNFYHAVEEAITKEKTQILLLFRIFTLLVIFTGRSIGCY